MPRTEHALRELIDAARGMREAANTLWWAHNPMDGSDDPGGPPSVEEAQEAHSRAFARLQRAEYYAEALLPIEMKPPEDRGRPPAQALSGKEIQQMQEARAESARNAWNPGGLGEGEPKAPEKRTLLGKIKTLFRRTLG